MSRPLALTDAQTVLFGLRRQQVMDLVRGATFVGALLLAWVSLKPFEDLSNLSLRDLSTGNELPMYVIYGLLSVLAFGLAARGSWPGIKSLATPSFLMFAGWTALSVVTSLDPSTSIRRLALTVCVIAVAAMLMLLPKTQNELARWLGIATLTLLAACFVGILLAPSLSMHLATDAQEPQLAGDWRGVFGHKNYTAAISVMVLFIGIYVARAGLLIPGLAVVVMSIVLLIGSGGKSSSALCIGVLGISGMVLAVRSIWLRATFCFMPLLLLNLLSLGTVMSDKLESLARMLPLDTTFTGRTDIWEFAIDALQQRLLTGYGFAAFWGSNSVKDLREGAEWAETASHSHHGYLDTALAMGIPGLILLFVVLAIAPFRNFQSATENGNGGPLATMLLQIWLFGIYQASMESFFLSRADPIWFTFLFAVFGLHYIARFRINA